MAATAPKTDEPVARAAEFRVGLDEGDELVLLPLALPLPLLVEPAPDGELPAPVLEAPAPELEPEPEPDEPAVEEAVPKGVG